jgi:hypothetical protein
MNNVENIDEYIEKQIEIKLNNLLKTLPDNIPSEYNKKPIYEFTVIELYKNTLQTLIDIINDLSNLKNNKTSLSIMNYNNEFYDIFLKEDRRIYIGIVLIILSFIIYFIDGASV